MTSPLFFFSLSLSFFFVRSLQRPSRYCPAAAIFRAHDWTKSSLVEWSRGRGGASARRARRTEGGRCSLRSLTPRYNGAGCTGKIMAVNLRAELNRVPPFFPSRRAARRDISSFRFPLVHPYPISPPPPRSLSLSFPLLLLLFFYLRQKPTFTIA